MSLRRIEKYLNGAEVSPVLPLHQQSPTVAFRSCTVTWPQDMPQTSVIPSAIPTPMRKFMLVDMTLEFPKGELSLVCGKLGSGKTLLLLGMSAFDPVAMVWLMMICSIAWRGGRIGRSSLEP